MATLYETLGVNKDATPVQIKAAYRSKAKQHHPDKGGDEALFKQVKAAYEVLSNQARRKQYDETGQVDDTELQDEARLRQELIQLILGILDQVLDVDGTDVVKMARRDLNTVIRRNREAIRTANNKVSKYQRALCRMRCDSGENLLAIGIQNHIDIGLVYIKGIEKTIEGIEKQLMMLDSYIYDTESHGYGHYVTLTLTLGV
ncbi:DnaJ domain-containing protein [Methylovulum miyakonense]|uniref:DnaJ domain-containing protein n=1 Tax=Methylovulum miyakonense TaxID=645578 RepID=UPI00037E6308|nr:DnaJ domain-containing protein [Methylovulum miyakonense]